PKAESPKPAVKDEIRVVSRESLNKPGLTLQLGAFSNAANVQGLVAQLRKNGFKAYTVPSTPKDGVLTKVFVGPDISEAKLKKMQEDIEARLRLKGRIVPFNPLES
ncbi:MAG: SPOR domain-containing protein, partial [Shewanella sp.]